MSRINNHLVDLHPELFGQGGRPLCRFTNLLLVFRKPRQGGIFGRHIEDDAVGRGQGKDGDLPGGGKIKDHPGCFRTVLPHPDPLETLIFNGNRRLLQIRCKTHIPQTQIGPFRPGQMMFSKIRGAI